LLGELASRSATASAQSDAPGREFHGSDLSGWKRCLGDGVYTAPGEAPVNAGDIDTLNLGSYSELQANIHAQRIMAHNITTRRIKDRLGLSYRFNGSFQFRLPYLPEKGDYDLNAQTLEGGMFVWDGAVTRLDYGLGFQWMLNPGGAIDADFGTMRCWTSTGGGRWENVGYLEPDTSWHTAGLLFDLQQQTTSFTIDDQHYPTCFTATPKPASWGREIAPGLQMEIISLFPGERGRGALHKAEFKDWIWTWEPNSACNSSSG
jgi:hypothetical protein